MLTGDSLFVGSAGRPDLLGSDQTEELTRKLFHTLRDFYLGLPDSTMIFPAHGHGSPCGADIGDRLLSTIGYEKKFNSYLQIEDIEEFKKHALEGAPPVPEYYPRMKEVNAEGPEILHNLPVVPGLPPEEFRKKVDKGDYCLIDTRPMLAFGGGHIPGALNIGGSPMLSIWAGWLLDPDVPILLVLHQDSDLEQIVNFFIRTGYTKFAGYLAGGMTAWDNAGLPLAEVGQMDVREIRDAGSRLQLIDVRTPDEREKGYIPGSKHAFLPELREKIAAGEIDPNRPTAVYCASGYRASLASSILKREGFDEVCNIPGSWLAWKKAGYPVETDQ